MLKLPLEWRVWNAGRLGEHYYQEVNGHLGFVASVVRAALAINECPMGPKWDKVECLDDCAWQIGRSAYVYVPDVDDTALVDCDEFAKSRNLVVFITPSSQERALRSALTVALQNHYPTVVSFGTFLATQLTMASLQCDVSYVRLVAKWLLMYNSIVRDSREDNDILIESNELFWVE